MADIKELEAHLAAGDLVILDGAIGTELERLGAPMHGDVWCAEALESHPDLVLEVHRSYIAAGADVITANSYASPPHALEFAGLGDKTDLWNQKAMAFAKEACDRHATARPVYIAGSVSTFGSWRKLSAEEIAPSFRRQAEILAENGADLLLLETLGSERDVTEAAVRETAGLGLPVWVSMSCLQDRSSGELLLGDEESQDHSETRHSYGSYGLAIEQVMALGGSACLNMHSDLKVALSAVEVLKGHYDGPIGVYPNAGYWQRPNWSFVDQVTPEAYLTEAQGWYEAGARIIGGCCGIGPDHIRALRQGLPGTL